MPDTDRTAALLADLGRRHGELTIVFDQDRVTITAWRPRPTPLGGRELAELGRGVDVTEAAEVAAMTERR